MLTVEPIKINWERFAHELGPQFAARAKEYDKTGAFVHKNYEELKENRFFSAMIPESLDGGGMNYEQMCHLIRTMAHYCGSTALAFSMHQHLVGATVWKFKHKNNGKATLEKVVQNQLVLVSTGARDWLQSNGTLEPVEGGYLFYAKKSFASQSAVGDVAVTSAPIQNSEGEWKVLHFPTPIQAEGVTVLDDWDVMGMRATGSQTIVFDKVFIPNTAIALERPREGFHMVWNVVLTIAMPLIMSAYVGIAEKAVEIAISMGKQYPRNQEHLPYIIGKLNNTFLEAKAQWRAMYTLTDNLNFKPAEAITSDILSYKTNVADATIRTVQQAMEAIGGQALYRKNELERLFRDVQGAQFHPLPKWDQYAFTGKRLLSNSRIF